MSASYGPPQASGRPKVSSSPLELVQGFFSVFQYSRRALALVADTDRTLLAALA